MGTPGRPHGTPVDVGLGASFCPVLHTQAQTELTTSQLVQDSETVHFTMLLEQGSAREPMGTPTPSRVL